MLKRSHIVAAEEDLQDFYRELEASSMAALWGQRGGALEPKSKAVPFVPGWTFHEHVNTGDRPAILFSHTDVPVMRSLDLYREEAHPAGRQ